MKKMQSIILVISIRMQNVMCFKRNTKKYCIKFDKGKNSFRSQTNTQNVTQFHCQSNAWYVFSIVLVYLLVLIFYFSKLLNSYRRKDLTKNYQNEIKKRINFVFWHNIACRHFNFIRMPHKSLNVCLSRNSG